MQMHKHALLYFSFRRKGNNHLQIVSADAHDDDDKWF